MIAVLIVIILFASYYFYEKEKFILSKDAPIEKILTTEKYKTKMNNEMGGVVLPHLENFMSPQSMKNVTDAVLLNSTIDYTNTPGTEYLLQKKLY